jgi:hypothetical protein
LVSQDLQTTAPEFVINQIGFLAWEKTRKSLERRETNVSKDIFQVMETLFTEDGHDRVSSIRIKRKL